MAAAGYTPVSLYYSTTAATTPTAPNLALGELAINIADGKLFYKDTLGAVYVIANKTTATGNLPGGTTGAIAYQSAPNATTFLALSTLGYIVTAGASAPVYTNPASLTVGNATLATRASNINGGAANQIVYQTGANTTAFAPAPTTAGLVLGWTGTVFNWVSAPAATTATSLAGGAAFQVPYQSAPSITVFSPNFQFDGTYLRVGDTASLASTNPIIAATGNQNLYIQSYIYNANSGASASADIVAYANNSTDASGWIDMSFTSSNYADASYTVVGANEGSIFMSAPSGASKSGNLVYATDSTGTTNSHQWYVGGFAQAKGAWKMQLTSTGLQLANALGAAFGGTGLTSAGTAGNVLTSTGSGWASVAAPVTGPTTAKTYFMGQF
jgi:hypothetical protein